MPGMGTTSGRDKNELERKIQPGILGNLKERDTSFKRGKEGFSKALKLLE